MVDTTFKIMLKWVESRDGWHMYDENGKFVQEFYNCENINISFQGLNKNFDNWYKVRTIKLNNKRS